MAKKQASFSIAGRKIGPGHPAFLVAELGLNHGGNFETAWRMLEAARDARADAITFQLIGEEPMTRDAGSQKTLYSYRLTPSQFQQLAERARQFNLIVGATVTDLDTLRQAVGFKSRFIKILSADIDHYPLLRALAKTRLPAFLSLGGALSAEIDRAVGEIKKVHGKIVLFHTTMYHPTPPAEIHTRRLLELKKWGVPVGYCDHSQEPLAILSAIALGACGIEKYFILDPKVEIGDFRVSATPSHLVELFTRVRHLESVLGNQAIIASVSDAEKRKIVRRSIVAKRAISKGEIIAPGALAFMRPATGLSPSRIDRVLGRKAAKLIAPNEDLVVR